MDSKSSSPLLPIINESNYKGIKCNQMPFYEQNDFISIKTQQNFLV